MRSTKSLKHDEQIMITTDGEEKDPLQNIIILNHTYDLFKKKY